LNIAFTQEEKKTFDILIWKLKQYQGLAEGLWNAKEAIKYSVKHELPHKRLNQSIEIAEKKMLPLAIRGINRGRSIIPHNVNDEETLDNQIDSGNIVQWGMIFESERFKPIITSATVWKSKTLIFQRVEENIKIRDKYIELLTKNFQSDNLSLSNNIEDLMLSNSQNSGFQLNHIPTEIEERAKLTDEYIYCTEKGATDLADYLFETYVEIFLQKLSEICREDPLIFKPSYNRDMMRLEVITLVRRVSVPLIRAILLWPHEPSVPKLSAVKELTRVNPWISLKIDRDPQGLEAFAQAVKNLFGWEKRGFIFKNNGQQYDISKFFDQVFDIVDDR